MNVDLVLSAITHVVLMPPAIFFAGIGAGALLQRWKPRAGKLISVTSLLLLAVLSTEAGARLLVAPLESLTAPLPPQGAQGAAAIVVLAAGRMENAADYAGQDVPDLIALARLRYGAHLQHQTGLPLLVSGGNATPDGLHEPKARSMARVLREDFRTPVAWIEEASATTAENAAFSARILKQANVKRILLVTQAMHMARAQRAFENAGLEVVAAPTMFHARGELVALHFLPSAAAMQLSYYASYEWAGLALYRLRQAIGR